MEENEENDSNFFWPSYADLMTSLFFIMLVLYIITFVMLKVNEQKLEDRIDDLDRVNKILSAVENSLNGIKSNSELIKYEDEYKRFQLAFEVKFKIGQTAINHNDLEDPINTIPKIKKAGFELQEFVDDLYKRKNGTDSSSLKDVSYMIVISGYASHDEGSIKRDEYERSYARAYSLWDYWKNIGVDFEKDKYRNLVEVHIAGNGFGGVGRYNAIAGKYPISQDSPLWEEESKNQRFLIEIVPKLGDIARD